MSQGIDGFVGSPATLTALTLTAMIEAAGTLCQGLSTSFFEVGASFAVLGAGFGATMVLVPSVRGAIVPDELMGRVGAAGRLISWGTYPLGALFGGWIAETVGLRAPFIGGRHPRGECGRSLIHAAGARKLQVGPH